MGKGQVSIEYMMVLGLMFLLLVPLLVLFSNTQQDTQDQLVEGQLNKVGNTIRDAAERVYFAGEPAQEQVQVYMPEGVGFVNFNNTSIIFNVTQGRQDYALVINGLAPMNGTIDNFKGVHVITVRADDGVVQVSE
jgi:uncharacterized protein (UPF0333 family)